MFKKRSLFLLVALMSFAVEVFLIHSFPPDKQFHFSSITISVILIFFIVLFLFCFSFITLACKRKLQGILIGIFVVTYLLFRYFGLTKVLYQTLLVLIFISVELFFFQKKKPPQE